MRVRYSPTIPGNLFVGHDDIITDIMNGLIDGESYACIGGRRCGKTSLLLKVEEKLKKEYLSKVKPCYIDAQGLDDFTVNGIFRAIYNQTVEGLGANSWTDTCNGQHYENFKNNLEKVKPHLETKYGDNWLVVLLIDELDTLSIKLNNDLFFNNLRNFLMASGFKRNFRIVATGVNILSNLISHGSPLNNLRYKYLGIVSEKAADTLISFGFPYGFRPEVRTYFLNLTGRHPYIMQGICEKLPKDSDIDIEVLNKAKYSFSEEHRDFHTWLISFEKPGCTVYHVLSESKDGSLTKNELKAALPQSLSHNINDSLTTLKYHGVIDRTEQDKPKIAGEIFKEWFKEHCLPENIMLTERATLINALNIIIKAVNDSALRESDKKNAITTLNDALKKLKDTESDDKIDKEGLKGAFDSIKGILQTTITILKYPRDFVLSAEFIGKYIGDGVDLLAGLFRGV